MHAWSSEISSVPADFMSIYIRVTYCSQKQHIYIYIYLAHTKHILGYASLCIHQSSKSDSKHPPREETVDLLTMTWGVHVL